MSAAEEAARLLMEVLPKHEASMSIEHNEHKSVYESVEGYYDEVDAWISVEEREKAIATDDVWCIRWYPVTPVGFHIVVASSLAALLRYIAEHEFDWCCPN